MKKNLFHGPLQDQACTLGLFSLFFFSSRVDDMSSAVLFLKNKRRQCHVIAYILATRAEKLGQSF